MAAVINLVGRFSRLRHRVGPRHQEAHEGQHQIQGREEAEEAECQEVTVFYQKNFLPDLDIY